MYHNIISFVEYQHLVHIGIEESLLSAVYLKKEDGFYERQDVDIVQIGRLKKELQKNATLYIIDAGEGFH